jgi:cephalosporin-C deacetylase-like acetyl esterase
MELQLSVSPKSGNAGPGGKVRIVAAISGIDHPPEVLWTFLSTEQPSVAPVLQMASRDGGSQFYASLEVHLPVPGFQQVTCRLNGDERKVRVYREPEKLQKPLTSQPDFAAYWMATLISLSRIPMGFHIRDVSTAKGIRLSEVTISSLDRVAVRGWLEEPVKPGRYPAVLRVPGYGGSMEPLGMFMDRVVFSFNPRGHGNSQDTVKGKPEDFWIRGLDDKAGYFYQGAYMDCVRAMDFLVQHRSVDASRIAVWGGSQGGGLAFATAALSSNVALCLADIPFLCDWDGYFKLSEWPEMESWICDASNRSWQSTLKTLSYFDTMNLAGRIRCPVKMGIGLQDDVCPPSTSFAAFNRVRGHREFNIYPTHGHGVPDQHYTAGWRWIEKQFGI